MDRAANLLFVVTCPTSIVATAADWSGRLDSAEAHTAKILAIVSGLIAILIGLAILRRRRYETLQARMSLCAECKRNRERPEHCEVPRADRPAWCKKCQ